MNAWGYLDTRGAWQGAAALPEELSAALEAAHAGRTGAPGRARRTAATSTRAVVTLGPGLGAVACEAAAAVAATQLSVPFVVHRDGPLPRFVDEHTLALAVVLPGEDGKVGAAAVDAARHGAPLVVICVGAAERFTAVDAALHAEDAAPHVLHLELARAATPGSQMAAATVAVLGVLAAHELVPDPVDSVRTAAAALAGRRDAWMLPGAAPETLARRLGRTIPLVYGAEGVGAVAARAWKIAVNRNAKSPAFASRVPDVTYDELAGWGQAGDVTRQVLSLVLLRHSGEPADADRAFESVRADTDEIMANVFDLHAQGSDDLARFLDLVLFGEFVSLHMAGREGVDPGPTSAVEERAQGR